MGKLEEYRKEACFEKVERILGNLASFLRHDTVGGPLEAPRTKLYRILTLPLDELKRWEEYGGYDPEKSMWGRFVCTANRYLGCMMKMGLSPPWLRKPEVMIEVHQLYPDCVKYSEAAVGNVPSLKRGYGRRMEDVYISPEDLALFECWLEGKVGVEDIKRIYVAEDASEEVKARVKEFAEKYKIPVDWKIPCPSDDDKVYPEWEKPSDYKVTDESLKELVNFLKNRTEVCRPYFIRPIPDSVAAALAESLDMVYHREHPVGASDAISIRNERLREARYLAYPPPETACDRVVCERVLSQIASSMEKLK